MDNRSLQNPIRSFLRPSHHTKNGSAVFLYPNDIHWSQFIYKLLTIVTFLPFLSGCQSNLPTTQNTGSLRGDTILILRLPVSGDRTEIIAVSKEQNAVRSFVPRSSPVADNFVSIPDILWQRLDAIRKEWCVQPPAFTAGKPSNSYYEVTFQCGRINNPVFVIPPDQLPSVLDDLIDLIPSAQ